MRLKAIGIFRDIDFEGLINPSIARVGAYIISLFNHLEIQCETIRKLNLSALGNHIVPMKIVSWKGLI
jgi:hypothetical protein